MSDEPIAWFGDKRPEDAVITFYRNGTLILRVNEDGTRTPVSYEEMDAEMDSYGASDPAGVGAVGEPEPSL